MRRFAVIGHPIGHSFSPGYFAKKFKELGCNDSYVALDVEEISEIAKVVENEQLSGFNVTIPHKQSILPFLHTMDAHAAAINAVNTVCVRNGKLIGYNTDHVGFEQAISGSVEPHMKALVFGSGGSSLAICYALQRMGIEYHTVSRQGKEWNYAMLTDRIIEEHKILINTTPLGMHPKVQEAVSIPYAAIGADHFCFDAIYNPEETLFLQKCKQQSARVMNGLAMLQAQADKSWAVWNTE